MIKTTTCARCGHPLADHTSDLAAAFGDQCVVELADEPDCYEPGATRKVHAPQVARRTDGRWGVFCAACSREAGDYIYPCKTTAPDDEWPPAVLYAL